MPKAHAITTRLGGVVLCLSFAFGPTPGQAADGSVTGQAALSPLETLGRSLFEDASLSEPPGQSCASCHEAARAFTGNAGSPIAAVAQGSRAGQFGTRNAPTLMYLASNPAFSFVGEKSEAGAIDYTPTGGLFWDGRAATLADQVRGPFFNALEMNNQSVEALVRKVQAGHSAGDVMALFGEDAFKDPEVAMANIATAIAAFEASARFSPFSSRFDRFLRGEGALSEPEQRGFALFKDPQKGNCIACHAGDPASKDPTDWLFTDFTYDNLGLPRNRSLPANVLPGHFDRGLCEQPGIDAKLPPGVDRQSLCGAFKVPTLRNVALSAPYFHNGVFTTLEDAVTFYATRNTAPQSWYPKDPSGVVDMFDDLPQADQTNVNIDEAPYDRKLGEAPRLSAAEIEDLVSFLRTLTDEPGR